MEQRKVRYIKSLLYRASLHGSIKPRGTDFSSIYPEFVLSRIRIIERDGVRLSFFGYFDLWHGKYMNYNNVYTISMCAK